MKNKERLDNLENMYLDYLDDDGLTPEEACYVGFCIIVKHIQWAYEPAKSDLLELIEYKKLLHEKCMAAPEEK